MDLAAVAAQFQRDGYAVIPDFLSADQCTELRTECGKILDGMDPGQHHTVFSTTNMDLTSDDYFMTSGDKIRFFFEDGVFDTDGKLKVDKHLSVNKMGHALHVLSPPFKNVTFCEKMKKLVEAVKMVDPVVCQSMYIFKQPGNGGVVVPHQDSTFLFTNPMKLIGFWIALEDAMKDNGCLWVIPGSHKDGLAGERRMIINPDSGPGKTGTTFTKPPVEFDDDKFVPLEVKKGSMVLIHGEVVHKSAKNVSSRSRHVYTFHVYDQHQTEYSSQNWLQPTEAKTFTHFSQVVS